MFYTTLKAYLLSEHQTNHLKLGGVFGILVRVPVVVIGYHLNLGLFPFAIACTADFAVRGIYFYLASRMFDERIQNYIILHRKQGIMLNSNRFHQRFRWFDKQFLFYLMQNIFVGVCGLIDTGFGNKIDIDSVCVLSAYTDIAMVTYATYSIGSCAYRIVLDKAKTGFYIQLGISILLTILILCLSPFIPHIYSLTDSQYLLFEKCLKVHAISLPILAMREYLGNYAEYKCQNKIAIIGNVILYSTMITTDALVVFLKMGLVWLIVFTGICSAIYSVYMFIALKFWREEFKFNFKDIIMYLRHGGNICFNRLTGKVATIMFVIYASKLGTELYSIHSVCYSIQNFSECLTNALYTFGVVSSAGLSSGTEKYNNCIKLMKKYAVFLIILAYAACYIMLFATHGVVPIKSCLPYIILYCSEVFALLFYETMKAYLSSEHQSKYLKYGGVCGIIVRVPIVIIGYHLNLGLFPFAIACTADFAVRGIYFYLASRKVRRKNTKLHNTYIESRG